MRYGAHPRRTPSTEDLLLEREGDDRMGRRITPIPSRDTSGAGIYFAGAAGANLVKIGWVLKVDRIEVRLDSLRTDCPYPVVLLHLVSPATDGQKRRLHKHFLAHHFHGEWFRWEGALRDFLERARHHPVEADRALLAQIAEKGFTMSMS